MKENINNFCYLDSRQQNEEAISFKILWFCIFLNKKLFKTITLKKFLSKILLFLLYIIINIADSSTRTYLKNGEILGRSILISMIFKSQKTKNIKQYFSFELYNVFHMSTFILYWTKIIVYSYKILYNSEFIRSQGSSQY